MSVGVRAGDAAGPVAQREPRRPVTEQAEENDAGPEGRKNAGAAAETMVAGGFVFVHRDVWTRIHGLCDCSTVDSRTPRFPFDGDAAVGDADVDFRAAAVELRFERANAAPGASSRVQTGDGDAAVHRARIQRGLRVFGNLERNPSVRALQPHGPVTSAIFADTGPLTACRIDRAPQAVELDPAVHHHGFDVPAQPVGLEPAVVTASFRVAHPAARVTLKLTSSCRRGRRRATVATRT